MIVIKPSISKMLSLCGIAATDIYMHMYIYTCIIADVYIHITINTAYIHKKYCVYTHT